MCNKCFADGSAYEGSEPVGAKVRRESTCGRCGGTGTMYPWGTCFACNGRKVFVKMAVVHDRAKLQASKARKEAREAAKRQAFIEDVKRQKMDLLRATEGASIALMKAQLMISSGDLLKVPSLKAKLEKLQSVVEDVRGWSQARVDLMIKLVDSINALEGKVRTEREIEEELRADPRNWIHSGRYVVEGEVVHTVVKDSQFGSVLKMIVRDDLGRKYWSTVPRGLAMNEGERGMRVRFTATVERSKDDQIFGFCSRPAKGELVEEATA